MGTINLNQGLVFVGLGLVAIEIILGAISGFDLFLIGLILVVSGFVGELFNNFLIALASITIFSFLYIFVGRKLIKNKLNVETKSSNIDALINKKALVIKKITPKKPGQVKINGEIWLAIADKEIEKDQEVVVKSISGVTLKVE